MAFWHRAQSVKCIFQVLCSGYNLCFTAGERIGIWSCHATGGYRKKTIFASIVYDPSTRQAAYPGLITATWYEREELTLAGHQQDARWDPCCEWATKGSADDGKAPTRLMIICRKLKKLFVFLFFFLMIQEKEKKKNSRRQRPTRGKKTGEIIEKKTPFSALFLSRLIWRCSSGRAIYYKQPFISRRVFAGPNDARNPRARGGLGSWKAEERSNYGCLRWDASHHERRCCG